MSRRIYGTMRAVQAELGALSSRIQEDLGAIQVIKTYGLDDVRRKGFIEGSEKLLPSNMEAAKVRIQLGPMLNTLAAMEEPGDPRPTLIKLVASDCASSSTSGS